MADYEDYLLNKRVKDAEGEQFNDDVKGGPPYMSRGFATGQNEGGVERAAPNFDDPRFSRFVSNIAKMESSNNYGAVNKDTGALGKYQVLPENVASWSKSVLGKTLTPEEFLADHGAQDQIAQTVLRGYVAKHGFEGAAQAWLGGEGSIGKTGRADANGTTVGDYGRRAMAGLDQAGPSAQPDPAGGEPAEDHLKHFNDAHESLQLTPQEMELYMHHLKNLWGGKGYTHQDGSVSTLFAQQSGFDENGKERTYLLPRVHDGRIVDTSEAVDKAKEKGLDSHPSYDTPEQAQSRYTLMHNFMDHDTEDYVRGQQRAPPSQQRTRPSDADRPSGGLINMDDR